MNLFTPAPRDLLLLCSDGSWSDAKSGEIAQALARLAQASSISRTRAEHTIAPTPLGIAQ